MQERSVNGSDYVTALYIRLSQEDRDISFQQDKTESNSITNQRALYGNMSEAMRNLQAVRSLRNAMTVIPA